MDDLMVGHFKEAFFRAGNTSLAVFWPSCDRLKRAKESATKKITFLLTAVLFRYTL